MSWALFVTVVLPAGAALTTMLGSGQELAMWMAHKVLLAPFRIGNLRVSLAVFMTALCGTLSALCYSSLRRAEALLARVSETQQPLTWEQGMRQVFFSGRNLYICLLGFTLWAVAWRLNSLYVAGQLASRKVQPRSRNDRLIRGIYLAIGLVSLLLADVPLCRLNYNFQLAMFVTPKKDHLVAEFGQSCKSAMLHRADANATDSCAEFCANARQLSEDRLWSIQWARGWHPVGKRAAMLFDDTRGVQQGTDRIDELFKRKTCLQVVKSIDKSNRLVNALCVFFAGFSVLGFLSGVTNAAVLNVVPSGTPGNSKKGQ